jgi:uncharacterized membrane protein
VAAGLLGVKGDTNHMSANLKSQSEIVRKNVAAIVSMQQKEAAGRTVQDRLAAVITSFSGSMAFVYIHATWFGLWFILNLGILHIPYLTQFDPYPFGLLTVIVSLEAIFLSTFVLIAQNNLSALSERRAELDLQVNLLAEQKTAKVLELLDKIAKELDTMHSKFNYTPDPETEALKLSPEPHEVLNVMEQTIRDSGLKEETAETTDEMRAVRVDVKEVGERVDELSSDVEELRDDER